MRIKYADARKFLVLKRAVNGFLEMEINER
jgi:hypothetical protein